MTNRYSLDVDYFRRELKALSDSLDDRTPGEAYRYLTRLADVAAATTPAGPDFDSSKIPECKDNEVRPLPTNQENSLNVGR